MIQLLVSLVFTQGLALTGVDFVRAKVLPIWAAVALVVGGLTTVYFTPVFWKPGAAWSVLWRPGERTNRTGRWRPPAVV